MSKQARLLGGRKDGFIKAVRQGMSEQARLLGGRKDGFIKAVRMFIKD